VAVSLISPARAGNHCHCIRIWKFPDLAARDFAIGEKVSRSDLKTIFILRFEVKKGDHRLVQGRGV
jgi:hypothetical protein